MVQWLLALPKNILVVLVLGTAIVFIVANDPPHTVCRTQIENFKEQQKGIIYKDPETKNRPQPLLQVLIKNCKKHNSPGSCYGLFSRTKVLINGFKVVSVDCKSSFSDLSEVRNALFAVYGLMIRIAWGSAPPTEHQDKLHWLSEVDMSLFCLLKKEILFYYGKSGLLGIEQKIFQKLPEAKGLSEIRIRELAIVSENCARYPSL